MARRRFFPSPETESAKQLYQALIVAGVGIAFIGIFSTSYLAITQGIKEPFDAWIAGSIYFWMMTNQPKASSANKDEQDHSNMNYEEAWMKDDDVARRERMAEVEFDCWVSWLAHQSTKHPWNDLISKQNSIEKNQDIVLNTRSYRWPDAICQLYNSDDTLQPKFTFQCIKGQNKDNNASSTIKVFTKEMKNNNFVWLRL